MNYNVNISKSIQATKKGFEESFSSGTFYNRQTQDKNHLEKILNFLPIKPNMKILDLGVGSGYLSFPIAETYPDCLVVGLDIVEKALEINKVRADRLQINNLQFVNYNGMDFPFHDKVFDMVITRYALHHFPQIEYSIAEVSRVLKKGGYFFIADPRPNEGDVNRFVDDYMQLKKDGHIKFYTKKEWEDLCKGQKMNMIDSFNSSISFPKKKDTALGFEEVLGRHDRKIIESYDLKITEDEIYITEQVNNILFVKN